MKSNDNQLTLSEESLFHEQIQISHNDLFNAFAKHRFSLREWQFLVDTSKQF